MCNRTTHRGLLVVEARQAVHELCMGIAGTVQRRIVDLVAAEQLDALRPNLFAFAHRDPHIGVHKIRAG